jgi:hypothetical protein
MLESMIAAPIWAVMHASPDGHEWSGKGAQGYMVILGMVLRPTLMIFGLVGSIIIVNVMMLLMKTMFYYASGLVGASAGVGPLATIVLMFLYVWLAIQIVNQALKMVTDVPSAIMRWVGGPTGDPFGSGVADSGASFTKDVISKGTGAAKASAGAVPGKKDEANDLENADDKKAKAAKNNQVMPSASTPAGVGGGSES